jgi:hypothetical protein
MSMRFTPAIADAIVGAVRRGVPPSTAARAAGISDATVLDWIQAPISGRWRTGDNVSDEYLAKLNEFRDRILHAQACYESELVQAISEAGKTVGKSGVPEWRANAWLANNHPAYRKTYRQERFPDDASRVLNINHVHTLVREMSNADVLTAFNALPSDTNA